MNKIKISGLIVLVWLTLFGCASVNYVGRSYDTTMNIEIYYSADEIVSEYTVIGHAIGLGLMVSPEKIREKLTKEAKDKGADAILITGIGKGEVLIATGLAAGENQISASFIKFN